MIIGPPPKLHGTLDILGAVGAAMRLQCHPRVDLRRRRAHRPSPLTPLIHRRPGQPPPARPVQPPGGQTQPHLPAQESRPNPAATAKRTPHPRVTTTTPKSLS